MSLSDVKGFGDETHEWKGTRTFEKAYGYYFRQGKVVVTVNSSSKPAAPRFATRTADQL